MLSPRNLLALGLATAASASQVDTEGLPDTGLNTSSWVRGELPPLSDMINAHDFQIAAKNAMDPEDYAYYRTAASDEISYHANLNIWDKLRLNAFRFTDVSNVNLKTKMLGYEFDLPFFIAPAAQAGRASSGAEFNLVKAAHKVGAMYAPSISATKEVAEIAAQGAPDQIMFHQTYPWKDRERAQREIDEIEAAGFKGIFVTIDNTGTQGVRDRDARFTNVSASGDDYDLRFDVAALQEYRNMTKLPIVPKGIKSAHDAKLLADLGFPALYVSNHGGRQVDGSPTAVEILLEIHAECPEVFDQLEIYVDGGVRRGTHILALIALGARAVGLARPAMFANVFGQDGVDKLLEILKEDVITSMRNLGEANIDLFRGNTTFINTRRIEVDLYGAPLGIKLDSKPFFFDEPPTII